MKVIPSSRAWRSVATARSRGIRSKVRQVPSASAETSSGPSVARGMLTRAAGLPAPRRKMRRPAPLPRAQRRARMPAPYARRASACPPHLGRGLDDERELGALLVEGEAVALLGGGE